MSAYDLEYWQAAYDERAGILEFDEGFPRAKAEALARQWIIEHRGTAVGLKTTYGEPRKGAA
jgi:hypothetical protein